MKSMIVFNEQYSHLSKDHNKLQYWMHNYGIYKLYNMLNMFKIEVVYIIKH